MPPNESFPALLHRPVFGTSLPEASDRAATESEALRPPPSQAQAQQQQARVDPSTPDAGDGWAGDPYAGVGPPPTLRLAGQESGPRNAGNSLLRERVPLVPVLNRKRKRHPFRFLFRLLVVGTLLAGATAAVWYEVLPRLESSAAWAADVELIADEVAAARALTWDHPVRVTPLAPVEYSGRLAQSILGINDGTVPAFVGEWRAMGLAEGSADLTGIGSEAVAARPAFFDAATDTVYTVESLVGPLRVAALRRALTEALIAQQPDAPRGVPGSPADLAARLLTEADAATLAQSLPVESADIDAARMQRNTLVVPVGSPSRYPVDLIVGDAGVTALFAAANDTAERTVIEALRPQSDAALLDVGRPMASLPDPVSAAGGNQRGMVYWYYVLASRLPSDEAWHAATAWNGDDVVVTGPGPVNGLECVTAAITTTDAAGRDRLMAALTQWSASAPPEAATTIGLTGSRIDVSSCDPGGSADTITTVAVPFGNAVIERALVGSLDTVSDAVRTCTVGAVRGFGLVGLVRSGDQATADRAMSDIRNACATAV
ncbi:MAG: hypothetical protein RLZZ362_2295 [Actinomycetota bacterium]